MKYPMGGSREPIKNSGLKEINKQPSASLNGIHLSGWLRYHCMYIFCLYQLLLGFFQLNVDWTDVFRSQCEKKAKPSLPTVNETGEEFREEPHWPVNYITGTQLSDFFDFLWFFSIRLSAARFHES